MGYHAQLSPSSAHRWTSCTASIKAAFGLPNENNEASMSGTCCHQMSAEMLQVWIDREKPADYDMDASPYLGRKMLFWVHRESDTNGEDWEDAFTDDLTGLVLPPLVKWRDEDLGLDFETYAEFTYTMVVTDAFVQAVEAGTTFVMERALQMGGHLEVEQRVPIGHFTGEIGATGTSDVVLIYDDMIESMDFKYGRHKVHAYDTMEPARGDRPPVLRMNLQLSCYILGAYEKFAHLAPNIRHAKSTIIQPFLNHVSEYQCTIEELVDLRDSFLATKAEETRVQPVFMPSYDNCHYCKARNPADASRRCKARDAMVLSMATEGFDEAGAVVVPPPPGVDQLGVLYAALDFIREWCDDIGARVFQVLKDGGEVRRADGLAYVLVQGRKGDRKWDDPAAVEAKLKHMRLRVDEMYTMKVIGPAVVEKLAKVPKRAKADAPPPRINSLQWKKLQEHITQSEGGMTVALETDSRPALPSAAEGFEEVADDGDIAALLGL